MESNNLEQEKDIFILNYINRLYNENCIKIALVNRDNNKLKIDINIHEPEWYVNLDINDRNIIFSIIQSQLKEKIKNINFKELIEECRK